MRVMGGHVASTDEFTMVMLYKSVPSQLGFVEVRKSGLSRTYPTIAVKSSKSGPWMISGPPSVSRHSWGGALSHMACINAAFKARDATSSAARTTKAALYAALRERLRASPRLPPPASTWARSFALTSATCFPAPSSYSRSTSFSASSSSSR